VTTPEKLAPLSQETQESEQAIFPFQSDDVTRIEIAFEGQQLVGLRTPEGWKREGDEKPLPSAAVDDFLGNMAKIVDLGEVEGGAEQLSEYGLEPPRAHISIQLKDREKYTLVFGKNNPVNTSLYARVNNAPQIILIGSVISWDIRKLLMAAASQG
jgi:hypothetical protein